MDNYRNYSPKNDYLLTLLRPWDFHNAVPDLDMTSSTPKSVLLSATLTAPYAGAGLLWFRPHARTTTQVVGYFVWSTSLSRYVFCRWFAMDEDITENFTLARYVSGGLKVVSSTTPAGYLPINGVFNAVMYQELPPILDGLTFQNLISYKRSDLDVEAGTTVSSGVVALAHPNGNHEFQVFDTDSVTSTNNVLVLQDSALTPFTGTGTAFVPGTIAAGGNIYDSDLLPNFLPNMLLGMIRFNVKLNLTFGAVSAGGISIKVYHDIIDETTGVVTPVADTLIMYVTSAVAAPFTTSGNLDWMFFATYPVTRVTIVANAITTTTVQQGIMEMTLLEYYQPGNLGPGSIIAFSGLTPATTVLSLSGVANYEVVPNASLSRQLTTGYGSKPENPLDMELVERFLSNGRSSYGVRLLMSIPQYEAVINSGKYEQWSDNEFLAQASGFTDALKSIWRTISPFIKTALPAVGSLLGPAGTMVGQGLAGFIPDPQETNSASVYARKRGFASGFLLEESTSDDDLSAQHPPERSSASLLGLQSYIDDVNDNMREVALVPVELEVDKKYYPLDPNLKAVSRLMVQKGVAVDHSHLLVENQFPVKATVNLGGVKTNGIYLAKVTASATPIAPETGRHTFLSLKFPGSVTVFILSNQPTPVSTELPPQTSPLSSIILALEAAFLAGGVNENMYLLLQSPVDFDGGSLGAAVFATAMGWFMPGPISGAVSLKGLYLPNDIQLKQATVNSLGLPLLVVGEYEDFGSDTQRAYQHSLGIVVRNGKLDPLIMLTSRGTFPFLAGSVIRPSILQTQGVELGVDVSGTQLLPVKPATAPQVKKIKELPPDMKQPFLDWTTGPDSVIPNASSQEFLDQVGEVLTALDNGEDPGGVFTSLKTKPWDFIKGDGKVVRKGPDEQYVQMGRIYDKVQAQSELANPNYATMYRELNSLANLVEAVGQLHQARSTKPKPGTAKPPAPRLGYGQVQRGTLPVVQSRAARKKAARAIPAADPGYLEYMTGT